MKIKLIENFRGRETGEKLLEPGMIWDCDVKIATRLINNGTAEAFIEEPPVSAPPEPARKGKAKK